MPHSTLKPMGPSADCRCRTAACLVADVAGLPLDEVLHRKRRGRRSSSARALAMYLAHVGLGEPLSRVARAFNRHRSTVSHACRQVEECREDPDWDGWVERLEERVRHETEASNGQ